MIIVIAVIIRVICGVGAAAIANAKGRSVAGWFFGGFFLEIIGVVIVACLSNLNKERAIQQQNELEQRRLREQLRQERYKTEAFRQYAMGRFDAHDQALGMDTRPAQAALPEPQNDEILRLVAAVENDPSSLSAAGGNHDRWFYESNGAAVGPVTVTALRDLLNARRILPTTLLWTERLGAWTPLHQVEPFQSAVNG
ncbi:MAG TPA: hypothetical protein DCX07_00045 [Phycisphaerales bacterium]|nr:hypothetical protein [Phycisphaerales bacterium]